MPKQHAKQQVAQTKQCPECDATVKGEFPPDFQGPIQYGDGIKAFVICLLVTQMVALKRTQQMIKTIIGKVISEATILGYVMRLYVALEPWEIAAKKQLLQQHCIHTDETSLESTLFPRFKDSEVTRIDWVSSDFLFQHTVVAAPY